MVVCTFDPRRVRPMPMSSVTRDHVDTVLSGVEGVADPASGAVEALRRSLAEYSAVADAGDERGRRDGGGGEER
jgi:hypothetical protein